MLQLRTYDTPQSFLDRTQALLERREASNNLILGLADTLIRTPGRYREWHLWTVEDADVQAAVLWTPPHNLNLYAERPSSDINNVVIRYLLARRLTPPGVTGRVETAQAFADAWTRAVAGTWQTSMHMRVYELRQVSPPEGVDGGVVQASEAHQALAVAWIKAFNRETMNNPISDEDAAEQVGRHVTQGTLFLWTVGDQPVSMAAMGRQTRHGRVIGLVYTPPEQRGHGYASALVADVSRRILDSGKQFCALFTDLKNPISNSIYQRIGYRPLDDFDDLKFEPRR